jgi:UDP-N-acetylmuramoyl-tripeptide--D-alanyl-D-alanine ligase
VHIEFFPSREALVAEKLSIARKVKLSGTLILPSDEPEILAIRKDNPVKALSYGINAPADVSANFIETTYDTATGLPSGIAFKLNYSGNSIPVRIPGVLGIQHVYPLVAATAVGLSRGMSITAIIDSFSEHIPPRGRMNILNGLAGSAIIDDTYNASPDAVAEALSVLQSLKVPTGSQKIAVLGDMMELGKFSQDEHKKVGALTAQVLKDAGGILVTIGQRSKGIREAAIALGMPEASVFSFDTSREAGPHIAALVKKGDIILVKGSQSPRLERISEALLADPSQAEKVLVRQDAEWKNR